MTFVLASLFSLMICIFALLPLLKSEDVRDRPFTADVDQSSYEKGAWLIFGVASPKLTQLEKRFARLRVKLRSEKSRVRNIRKLN